MIPLHRDSRTPGLVEAICRYMHLNPDILGQFKLKHKQMGASIKLGPSFESQAQILGASVKHWSQTERVEAKKIKP